MVEFVHSSLNTRIIDRSFVTQTAQGTTKLYAAILAERGVHNDFLKINDPSEFINEYGEPNLSLYGQASYNVLEWVRAGGEAIVMRCLPDNAQYANSSLVLYIGHNGTKKLSYPKTEPVYQYISSTKTPVKITDLTQIDTFLSDISIGSLPTANSSGAVVEVPLLTMYSKSKGAWYSFRNTHVDFNNFGWKLEVINNLDRTFSFRTYELNFTAKNDNGDDIVIEGPFIVSFDKFAKNKSRESVYISDVVNKYSKYFGCKINQNNVEVLSSYFRANTNISPILMDIIFGQERKIGSTSVSNYHTSMQVVVGSTSAVTTTPVLPSTIFGKTIGLNTYSSKESATQLVSGGSNNTSTTGNPRGLFSQDSTVGIELIVDAYNGELNSAILDKLQYPIDMVLDANYDSNIKIAIQNFIEQRGDCLGILDVGFQPTVADTLNQRSVNAGLQMSDYRMAIFAHDFIIGDTYNGQDIKVTTPYFLAGKIPEIDNNFGIQYPFVGPRRGVLSGFKAINFFPNEFDKEDLYLAQINYVEKDPKRVNLGCQLTSQVQNSALSDINNVRALLRLKREVEYIMNEYRYEFNDKITLEDANYELNQYLQKWITNRTCQSISGKVFRNDYDRQQKIARVNIELVFTGVIERIFTTIVINR
jgi:hypothetical protein